MVFHSEFHFNAYREQNILYQGLNNADKLQRGNNNSKDNNSEMLDMKLSYLTGFDVGGADLLSKHVFT